VRVKWNSWRDYWKTRNWLRRCTIGGFGGGGMRLFSIRSAYMIVKDEVGGESNSMFEIFWKIKALPSTKVSTLRVLVNRIVTRVNLEVKGLEDEESMSHLFFKCKTTWNVWVMRYKWLGITLVDHHDSKTHTNSLNSKLEHVLVCLEVGSFHGHHACTSLCVDYFFWPWWSSISTVALI